jgi:plastocyanin
VALFVWAASGACIARAATVTGSAPGAAVVVLSGAPASSPVTVDMHNTNRSFMPAIVAVPVGSSVRFPNDDPFYHSIYSPDGPNPFDIGYYATGPGKVVALQKAGLVDVYCHIHASMHGTIVVADGPYVVMTGDAFRFDGIPTGGRYTVRAYYTNGTSKERPVTLGPDGATVRFER